MPGELRLDEPADNVLLLTISNPAKRNALDHAILDGIAAALGGVEDRARCVILTGADGMFSSGYDIGDIPDDVFAVEAEKLVAHPFTSAIDALDASDVRASRRSRDTRSAEGWSSRWCATSVSPTTASSSACRRPSSAWSTRTPAC